jgi:hypothetical protein
LLFNERLERLRNGDMQRRFPSLIMILRSKRPGSCPRKLRRGYSPTSSRYV